jgi:DhnA family fructose-bisphosphate aldolase class Ia
MLPFCLDGFVGRGAPGLVLQLDWTNMWRDRDTQLGFPEGRNTLIATVEQAARMGADGIMTYLFVGLDDPAAEAAQVDLNARVSRACEEYGLVRILEPMARGRRVGGDMFRPEYIAMHARMAAELGADIVKTDYSGDGASYRAVVDGCPVPIFIAGGPRTATTREALSMVSEARAVGVRGLMFGRNIVQADDPRKMTAAMASIVYRGASVDEALRVLEGAAVPAGGAT